MQVICDLVFVPDWARPLREEENRHRGCAGGLLLQRIAERCRCSSTQRRTYTSRGSVGEGVVHGLRCFDSNGDDADLHFAHHLGELVIADDGIP